MSVSSQSAVNESQDSTTVVALLIGAISAAVAALFVSAPLLAAALCFMLLMLAAPLRFDLFVYSLVFLLPLCPFIDLPWLPIRNISMLLHFVLFLGVWIRRRDRGLSVREWLVGSRIKKAILLFVGVALVSLALSSTPANANARSAIELLISYVITFFAVDGWVENRTQLVRVMKTLFLLTIAVALFGFYQASTGGYSAIYFQLYPDSRDVYGFWEGRITSFLFHFNSLAAYLNLVIPFGIACAVLAKDRATKVLAIVCACVAPIAVLLTQSRGGLLATAGVTAVMCWLLTPRLVTRIKLFSGSVLCGVLFVPWLLTHFDRLQGVDDATEISRLALWQAAVSLFLGHPILGVGYGNFKYLSTGFMTIQAELDRLDAHNLYLQLLSETGLIGFLAFAAIVALFFQLALKLIRDRDSLFRIIGIGLFGALSGFLIHGAVDFMFHISPQFGALFWMILGLCTSAAAMKPAVA